MDTIRLLGIRTEGHHIRFDFQYSRRLDPFFRDIPLTIEYPIDVTNVPQSILAVPFVCCVLPIVWLTDSQLVLPELDLDFFECIPEVKKGYETMFPESTFAGQICPERIVKNSALGNGCAAFFSGGLDATQTLVSHFNEKPHLISIWGADIRYDNEAGWNAVHKGIEEIATRFSLPNPVIRSNFRQFDDEGALNHIYAAQLQDDWWHGVKHSLGLLGHAAPYVWLHKLSTVYIASSNCAKDEPVRCASHPRTDNYVRFAGCRVVHDGYEFSRQDKARNVVSFSKTTGNKISLHACWQSQSGSNCCRCEKCYRTMTAIIAEGGDPVDYGFPNAEPAMKDMKSVLIAGKVLSSSVAKRHWVHIQNGLRQNRSTLKRSPYRKSVEWLLSADLLHIERIKPPLLYFLRSRLASMKFYQALHNIKERLK